MKCSTHYEHSFAFRRCRDPIRETFSVCTRSGFMSYEKQPAKLGTTDLVCWLHDKPSLHLVKEPLVLGPISSPVLNSTLQPWFFFPPWPQNETTVEPANVKWPKLRSGRACTSGWISQQWSTRSQQGWLHSEWRTICHFFHPTELLAC